MHVLSELWKVNTTRLLSKSHNNNDRKYRKYRKRQIRDLRDLRECLYNNDDNLIQQHFARINIRERQGYL